MYIGQHEYNTYIIMYVIFSKHDVCRSRRYTYALVYGNNHFANRRYYFLHIMLTHNIMLYYMYGVGDVEERKTRPLL